MTAPSTSRIPPQSGCSFTIRRGQVLRVTDPFGEQVSDLFSFDKHDFACRLSSGRSLDYASKIYLTTGDILYSNSSKPMFTIIEDTVRLHDFLLAPCRQEMFELQYKHKGHHPNCYENLAQSLVKHGIPESDISTTLNIFMNVKVGPDGQLTVGIPTSKAGDYIVLRSEMDMICGLTACSAEGSNNGRFKPIDFSIYG